MKHKNIIEYLSSKYPHHTWVLVHKRSLRSVYRLDADDVPEYFVKIYDPETALEKLRNLLRSRTLYEARVLAQLSSSGIYVPEVHAHVRFYAASALVTRAIVPATPAYEIEHKRQADIMLGLAVQLLKNNFFFTDMHAGNIVLDSDDRPCLLDAYEIEPCKRITTGHIISLFAQVQNTCDVTDDVLIKALEGLGTGYDSAKLAHEIRRKSFALRLRYVKKRVKRSLRQGSFSQSIPGDGYRAYVRRGYSLDLDDVLYRHKENIRHKTHVLKYQEKTQLSRVHDYCVKTYKTSSRLCSPYALRSWKGLLTLYFNRINVAEPVAIGLFDDRSSVLITHILDHPDLDVFFWKDYPGLLPKDKRIIAAAFGQMIGCLHSLNIYHADLKACNIKIEADKVCFFFLDTDRIEQRRSISYANRLKNLVQINTSIPVHISRSLRMIFLHAYAAHTGDDPHVLFQDVWKRSADREILFCTPSGDRIEVWPKTDIAESALQQYLPGDNCP